MKTSDIVIKDVKKIIYDKKTLALILLMPIVLTTILSFALKSAFEPNMGMTGKISIAIVQEYDLEIEKNKFKEVTGQYIDELGMEEGSFLEILEEADPERLFFEHFLGVDAIQDLVEYTTLSKEEAITRLKDNKVSAVVILPKNYVYNTYINFFSPFKNKVEIDIVKTSDATFHGTIVENLIQGYTEILTTMNINKEAFVAIAGRYISMEKAWLDLERIFNAEGINETTQIEVREKIIEGKDAIDSFAYYSLAIMTMFLFYSAGFGGRLLLTEKHEITYQRLKVAGVPLKKMYAGAFFTTFFVALIQVVVMMSYSMLVLKVHWGNISMILLTTLLLTLSLGSLGVLISSISIKTNSFKFANFFENGLVFFMAVIGGSFVPIAMLPPFFQRLSDFSINGLGVKMYSNVMLGGGFSSLAAPTINLIVMSVLFLGISAFIARSVKEVA